MSGDADLSPIRNSTLNTGATGPMVTIFAHAVFPCGHGLWGQFGVSLCKRCCMYCGQCGTWNHEVKYELARIFRTRAICA